MFESGQMWAAQLTEATAACGKSSGQVFPQLQTKGSALRRKKKMSRHQLVEMVLAITITKRKARSFYCFNWQPSQDSLEGSLEIVTRAGVRVHE